MLLAGAGGHAMELADILLAKGYLPADLAFFDDVTNYQVKELNGIRLITSLDDAEAWLQTNSSFALATGSPKVRKLLAQKLSAVGGKLDSVIAPSSITSRQNVKLGAGLNLMNFCMISANVTIGTGTLVNAYSSIHHDVIIGDFTEIAPGCRVLGGAEVGDNCFIGSGAIILPNIKVNSGAIVGAGAVVTKDVVSGAMVAGVPALRKK
ncbi:acetyltransferase [Botryobacter ruber]|uniref:acetyltransferase n=1 Tax=Botryobacter ruber TaxID=2171629 RepID=UPI000E0BBC9D|nr:acetyltransferase [Botryobacter ruber]